MKRMRKDFARGRLIIAIVSNIFEEAAIAVIVMMGLPELGINIPLPGLIVIMILWLVLSVFIYRAGTRALGLKPMSGFTDMVGGKGKAVNSLQPDGIVRINGELWDAASAGGRQIKSGEEVIVVGHEGLRLTVCRKKREKEQ